MKTQRQMFYEAHKQTAELNTWFLDIVAGGLTHEELKRNIERRPALWERFSNWLDRLPKASSRQNTLKQ